MEIGGALQAHRNLVLRHPPELVNEYVWNFITPGIIRGVSVGTSTKQRKFILLEQESNGIHWGYCRVKHSALSYHGRLQDYSPAPGSTKYCLFLSPFTTQDSVDCTRLRREQARSIGVKKQRFRSFKGSRSALSPTLLKLQTSAQSSGWQAAALNQTPATIWAHGNELAEYQV